MVKKNEWVLFSDRLPINPKTKPPTQEVVLVAENYRNLIDGNYTYVVLDAYNVSLEYSNYPEYRKIYTAWMKFDNYKGPQK